MRLTFCMFFYLGLMALPYAQKVGVVFSGGGAAGAAHIGVLKALEEENIPIDFIAGTSMGGIVGGIYASGYSPEQIEKIITSDEYISMIKGTYMNKNIFFFKKEDSDASWFNFKLSPSGRISEVIPTGIVSSVAIDFRSLEILGMAEAAAQYDFDSLYIPFRCVAADIYNKQALVLDSGHLTKAVRATSAYPLYFNPISIDGKLLFDGGLYNNFPSDIMYNDFFPDIIIGSNVSSAITKPEEDDFISQFKAMIMQSTQYDVPCENGIMISPEVQHVGTFDFDQVSFAIQKGYEKTKAQIDDIKSQIKRSVSPETRAKRRADFQKKFVPIQFDSVKIQGLNWAQQRYIERSLFSNKKKAEDLSIIREKYLKVFSDDKIRSIYPSMTYKPEVGLYDLNLSVKKEKDFKIGLGGNLTSRPVTTGFIGIKYNYLGFVSSSFSAKYYFGQFYNSLLLKARVDVPLNMPFYLEPFFQYNALDYFKTKNVFFDEDRPSFFNLNEQYAGLNIGLPVSNKGKVIVGFSSGKTKDSYYQTRDFNKSDTVDFTDFYFTSPYVMYQRDSRVKKIYGNKGTYTSISLRGVIGEERHIPGSTSFTPYRFAKFHNWLQAHIVYDNFYKRSGKLNLGIGFEAYYSNQELFNNYSASIAKSKSYKSTIESHYLFLESFRANAFAALSKNVVFSLRNNLELRLSGHLFQPYQRILRDQNNQAYFSDNFDSQLFALSANLVLQTPVAPVSFSANYYSNSPEIADEKKTPLTFFFHFGFPLFNKRALE